MSMTIGEVIAALERAPEPDVNVYFDFGGLRPTTVESWRGIYAEAALGFGESGPESATVASLLAELYKAIDGRKYMGWKGGEYRYSKRTPLHIDNQGEYSCTELMDVEVTNYRVILHTKKED